MATAKSQAEKTEFVKIFDGICRWNSRYERWCDFISMAAFEISNAMDPRHIATRSESYTAIRNKYSDAEFAEMGRLFSQMVDDMEASPIYDYLGKTFMQLDMGSSATGQFFTPDDIARLLAAVEVDHVIDQINTQGWVAINEPACGGGANVLAMARALADRGVNYQSHVMFVCQDLDTRVALMCYVQMSLYGLPGWVRIGDTLKEPITADPLFGPDDDSTWFTPMFCSPVWEYRRIITRNERRESNGRRHQDPGSAGSSGH